MKMFLLKMLSFITKILVPIEGVLKKGGNLGYFFEDYDSMKNLFQKLRSSYFLFLKVRRTEII